jgi:hypothetical protein
VAEVFYDELLKATRARLPSAATVRLLSPFLAILATTADTPHFSRVADAILGRLLRQSILPPIEPGESAPVGTLTPHLEGLRVTTHTDIRTHTHTHTHTHTV